MRRKSKPRVDVQGNPLTVPPHLAQFDPGQWHGESVFGCWWQWMEARGQWAGENDAPDDLLDMDSAMELQPLWTPEDIARMI